MRLLVTNLTIKDVQPKLKELVNTFFQTVPSGVGCKGFVKVNNQQFTEVMEEGVKWCVDNGYGWQEDLERIESNGKIEWADSSKISDKARKRGIDQLGTLGSGNHYLEIQHVKKENIIDEKLAKKFGIFPDQIAVMFHCLPGDTKILTEHGAWIRIKDLENKKLKVKCFDKESNNIINTEVEKFYKVKKKERIFKLKTISNKEIIATEDHPILTKMGLKFIEEIKINENIATHPFKGVEYEEPNDETIVDEENIRRIYNSDIIINDLKSRDLLPLRFNSPQLPILAKLAGYITGDGNIRKSGRGWRTCIVGDPKDLREIGEDILKLGFNVSKIYEKKSKGIIINSLGEEIKIEGHSYALECNTSAFTILLNALSVPLGKKTNIKFLVPKWLFKAPKFIKRLYLAGYFGAELTHPILLKDNYHFERLSLAIYKNEKIEDNGKEFLSQICDLLREYDIESIVYKENYGGRITKTGNTKKLVLRISSDTQNLLNFWSKINYEYCIRKYIESLYAIHYLTLKQNILTITANNFKVGVNAIKYKPYQYGVSHPSFQNFIEDQNLDISSIIVWDVVKEIEEIKNYEDYVYDIRIKNENHNFIADNFVVGNCGSRGFGHETATNYLKIFEDAMKKYNIKVNDKELSCAPFSSPEGQDYYKAMACAANMAFANRQVILHGIREGFEKVFKQKAEDMEMHCVYDVAHNLARLQEFKVDGKKKKLIVHRKGATLCQGPGNPEVSKLYRDIGSPVIIGGSMETGSYLLVGTEKADNETFSSTAHGSGRTMSRHQAKHQFRGDQLQKDMEKRGIYVKSGSMSGLAEEAGSAYKEINDVIEALAISGISKPVTKLIPIGNVK